MKKPYEPLYCFDNEKSKRHRADSPEKGKEDETSSEESEEEYEPENVEEPRQYKKRWNKRKMAREDCYDDKSKRKPCENNKLLGIPPPGVLGPVTAPIAPVSAAAAAGPAPAPLNHVVAGSGFTVPTPVSFIPSPAIIIPLTTIPLGTTLHDRTSTRLTVRNVSIKGQVRNSIVPDTPDATIIRPELRKLRIIIVVDHNGRNQGADPPELIDVISYALPDRTIPYEAGSIVGHANYRTKYRFTILLDRTITLGSWSGTVGAPMISPPYSVDYDYSVKSCFELTYGTDSDIPRKNEHILYLVGTDGTEPDSIQQLDAMYSVQLQFE